jgi:hypothetical protein
MKKNIHILALLAFAIVSLTSLRSFASADYYLKIEGVKGESKIVRCPDGTCSIDNLNSGDFKITVVDAYGNAIPDAKFKVTATVTEPRDASTGMATGKMYSTTGQPTPVGEASNDKSVTAPRDAATGLATGKRQHKPFVITKELDKSSPVLSFSTPKPEQGESAATMHWVLEVRVQRIEMK